MEHLLITSATEFCCPDCGGNTFWYLAENYGDHVVVLGYCRVSDTSIDFRMSPELLEAIEDRGRTLVA